jgi:hypothetical protein
MMRAEGGDWLAVNFKDLGLFKRREVQTIESYVSH